MDADRAALRPRPWQVATPAILFFVVATTLMLRRVEPFVDWYYLTAWYPTLLVLDAAQARIRGRYYLVNRPRFAMSVLSWSAVLWFFFELVNFRVANWYYVFLPPDRPARWLGTIVAFMTVFPAIFLAERLLAQRQAFEGVRWTTFQVGDRALGAIFLAGVAFAGLSLLWPEHFFALIWGALTLLLEPLNYRRDPRRSLIGDLARGRPARTLRLLVGGLGIGLLWELYNIEARSKWIYTVPGFENLKLFEMPVLGFFGFPVFALDCFVVYQSLVLARVAIPEDATGRRATRWLHARRTVVAALVASLFSFAVLRGMDRWNTDSLRPRLVGFWIADAEEKSRLAETPYADLFTLAASSPTEVAEATRARLADAEDWVAAAQLATLRGIGNTNARLLWDAGIRSLADLAAADPATLGRRLRDAVSRGRMATPAKVRVWVMAARRAASPEEGGGRLPAGGGV